MRLGALEKLRQFGCALMLLATACSLDEATERNWDRQWSSEHFRYHTRAGDDSVCEPIVETLEQHFSVLQEYLGFSWAPGDWIDYYKFVDVSDFRAASACPSQSFGCAPDTEVRSPAPFHDHELIHAYLSGVGRPPNLLLEGVAEALSCGGPPPPPPDLAWSELSRSPSDVDQRVGGWWLVGYLLQEFGRADFLRVYGMLRRDASAAELSEALETVYGQAADELWLRAREQPQPWTACVPVWDCSRPELPLGSSQAMGGDCSQSDSVRTFTLQESGEVRWSLNGGTGLRFGGCDRIRSPWTHNYYTSTSPAGELGTAYLAAGRYFVARPTSPPAEVLTTEVPGPASIGPDCATLTAWEPADEERRLVIFVPEQDGVSHVRLRLPAPRAKRIMVAPFESAPGRSVALCAGCTGECRELSTDATVDVELEGEVVLRVASPPQGDQYTALRIDPRIEP